MTETIKTITDRYSCRDFAPTPLTSAQLEMLGKAALAAPSAMNLQPWRIIIVTDKALLEEMDADALAVLKEISPEFYKRMADRGGKMFYGAPCLIVIAKDQSEAATLDCGIVAQNIALAAHSMGLGNVICGAVRAAFDGPRKDEWAARLGFPEGFSFGMSVCVGTAQSGKEPHELDYSKLTHIQ